jgi:fucose permease
MGLFTTMSYIGMALLPFIAGMVADTAGFFAAFYATAFTALTVAAVVPR